MYFRAMEQELGNLSEKALVDWELVQRACNGDEESCTINIEARSTIWYSRLLITRRMPRM